MSPIPNWYQLLGIPHTASEAEIRSAFVAAIKRCHPDTSPGVSDEHAKALIEARNTLTDPVRRSAYDSNQAQGGLIRSSSHAAVRWLVVCSHGLGQFSTIREALNEAKDGDRIYVLPGTYHESVLKVEKCVELSGQGSPEDDVILESDDDILYLQAHGAVVRGLLFRTHASRRFAVRATSSLATIASCRFSGSDGTGVLIDSGSCLTVESCLFETCQFGLRIDGARPRVVANTFKANTTGILVRAGSDCLVDSNTFEAHAASSIEIQDDATASILRNRVNGGTAGVTVRKTSRGSIASNHFSGLAKEAAICGVDGTIGMQVGDNRFD